MRRLILLRHGKAATAGLAGGDKERPLVERGRLESVRTAEWLASLGYAPDRVLVSSAVRTLSTWESVKPLFPDVVTEVFDDLYMADPETITDRVDAAPPTAVTVMVVGHNPGIQDLSVNLAMDHGAPEPQIQRLSEGFPTSTAAVFLLDATGGATLEAVYEPPRDGADTPRWAYVNIPLGDRN